MSKEQDIERYNAAAHAMQSGVAMEMSAGSKDTEPKHLRVGVNSALVNDEGLAALLIEKGIFTEDEYVKAIADAMEREKVRYEERLSATCHKRVTLA